MSETEIKYRPIPFWSWNDKIDPAECRRQVRLIADAGMGGFFIHARGGLETGYMSKAWFEAVSACIDEAEKYGLEPWVYDENGWPSGSGNGNVCCSIEYQQKKLKCEKGTADTPCTIANINGYHFYYEVNPYYIDVMSQQAVARFIECTHKPYYERYGNRIKGFFTDEPQLAMGEYPWSFELSKAYKEKYHQDLVPLLYDLFFNTETSRRTRINFWNLVCDLFSESYFRQIYEWCDERGLMLTGHLLAEESIASQIASSGSIMPHYEYFHMPGVDFLGRNKRRPLVPLQASSAAAQLGKKQILTESFAMCGHGVSFNEMKSIAEVQMVRGVTTICQHLQGYSMRGLRKRDFPPALFYQQPWWENYKMFNDLLAAEGKILAEGSDVCSVLLIVPMTEAWALYDGTQNMRLKTLSDRFDREVKALEKKHIIFHLGDEKLTVKYARQESGRLKVGRMIYDTVLVMKEYEYADDIKLLLNQFKENGGTVMSPDMLEGDTIADNEEILYTKRLTENGMLHFFVNQTDSEQRVKITIDGKPQAYVFEPYESKLLPVNKPKAAVKRRILPLDGEWKVKASTDNSLVLDFCDYYFDGKLIEKNGYITDIQRKACELKRPVDIQCDFFVKADYIPERLYLVCENPDSCRIAVNGCRVPSGDSGFFADISFRKTDISKYALKGTNKISVSVHFSQKQNVYDDIEAAKFSESVKNKLTFDSEIEAVYLAGDFSVDENRCIQPPVSTVTLEHIEKQGFPFFAGELTLERELLLDDTDYRLAFIQEGINVSKWRINGIDAGKYLWEPYDCDISSMLMPGINKIELIIVNNLRNLLGPHHFTGDEGRVGPSSFCKRLWLWDYPRNGGWSSEYCFAEVTVKEKGG